MGKPTKGSLYQQRRSSFSKYATRGLYSTSAVRDFLERVYAKVFSFVKKVYGAGLTILDDMLLNETSDHDDTVSQKLFIERSL